MNLARNRCLQKATIRIDSAPLAPSVLQQAFENFGTTGMLPDHPRLAAAVTAKALGGTPEPRPTGTEDDRVVSELLTAISTDPNQGPASTPLRRATLRECVFREAVHSRGLEREAARGLLQVEVHFGADVTNPRFLEGRTLPEHAGAAFHLLGFPERLAKAPYVRQGKRLFARLRALRQRIDQTSRNWVGPFEAAIVEFRLTAALPHDEFTRDVVLAEAELQALMLHWLQEDVAEWMAAFDHAAKATGDEQGPALAKVQELMRARTTGRGNP